LDSLTLFGPGLYRRRRGKAGRGRIAAGTPAKGLQNPIGQVVVAEGAKAAEAQRPDHGNLLPDERSLALTHPVSGADIEGNPPRRVFPLPASLGKTLKEVIPQRHKASLASSLSVSLCLRGLPPLRPLPRRQPAVVLHRVEKTLLVLARLKIACG